MGFFSERLRKRVPKTGDEMIRDFFVYWTDFHGSDYHHPEAVEKERKLDLEHKITHEYQTICFYNQVMHYISDNCSKSIAKKVRKKIDKSIKLKEISIKKLKKLW